MSLSKIEMQNLKYRIQLEIKKKNTIFALKNNICTQKVPMHLTITYVLPMDQLTKSKICNLEMKNNKDQNTYISAHN